MLTTLTALVLAAASPADEHRRSVEHAMFELCPRVVKGEIRLDDPAHLQAAGFTATAPRETPGGTQPRAVRGTGTEQIVISGSDRPGSQACSVWFGGPNNRDIERGVRRTTRRYGFAGGSRLRLGDGTGMRLFRQARGNLQSLTIIEADASGELGFEPATTAIIMRGF